jgi:hypothetical protein
MLSVRGCAPGTGTAEFQPRRPYFSGIAFASFNRSDSIDPLLVHGLVEIVSRTLRVADVGRLDVQASTMIARPLSFLKKKACM